MNWMNQRSLSDWMLFNQNKMELTGKFLMTTNINLIMSMNEIKTTIS